MLTKCDAMGKKIKDLTIVEKKIHSMTREFNYVVCSIEESKDIDDLSLDELLSSSLVQK